jgi:two-component system, cell cycle sensor histidine kinase and response regulator CckA
MIDERADSLQKEILDGNINGLPAPDERDILSRSIEIVYGYLPSGLMATVFVALAAALFLARSVSPLTALLWAGGISMVAAFRLANFIAYRRGAKERRYPARWKRDFLCGVTFQGILWGIGGYLLFPESSPLDQMFLVATFGGMAGGALIFLSPLWPAYIIYSSAMLLPVCVRLFMAGQPAYLMTACMLFVYLCSLALISVKTRRWFENHLKTIMEKEALAGDLQTACSTLESYRQDLERLVDERTRELSESNLRLQEEILEKEAERLKAELSETRFRELAELLPEMIFETDRQGMLVFLNRKGGELTGLSSDPPPQGFRLIDIFAPDDRKRFAENLERLMAGDATGPVEFSAIGADGTPFPVLTVSSPIVREGAVQGLRGILMDTTRIKELELSLRQTSKMEAIGTLAGGIAHDFNNILAAILGYSELALNKTEKDAPLHHYLEQIVTASERAKSLVYKILTFSRKSRERKNRFNAGQVVEEALSFISVSIPQNVTMVVDISPECGMIEGDESEIHQIVINLCTNAFQAMREKGGELRLSMLPLKIGHDNYLVKQGLDAGDYLELAVSDTGPGIEESIRSRIFDPFFTTKGVGEGSGMGLSVVHGIAKRYGGLITVESQSGEGATFRVFLRKDAAPDAVSSCRTMGTSPGHERILLVDDDHVITKVISDLLTSLGYRVTIANSGREALSIFSSAPDCHDLLITDLSMPGMGGEELIRTVRDLKPEIPVILCSGFGENTNDSPDSGTFLKLGKPVNIAELTGSIRHLIAGESTPA